MVTIAEIAKEAFDAVALEITDAIHAATLTRTVDGVYNTTTGAYETTTPDQEGRAVVDTVTPKADVFPDYVVGPADELVLLEGMTSAKENDSLVFAGRTRIVMQVQDIVAAGSLFFVIAR